jgi:sugar lactone lactonase YvrE/type IV secretory pathway VirB2 component (pilin)
MEAGTTPGAPRVHGDPVDLDGAMTAERGVMMAREPSLLDRSVPLPFAGMSGWLILGWVATLAAALALRLMRLDTTALGAYEARWAYDAWTLVRGQPPASGEAIPDVGATLLLLEGLAFFLFGATDVVARIVPALAGLAIVVLPLALRRWLGDPAALGMAALAAISPTLVYASRVVSPEVAIAALSLAAVALLVHLGRPGASPRRGAIALGVVVGTAFAAGPSAVSAIVSVLVGLALASWVAPEGRIRSALHALRREMRIYLLAKVVAIVVLFTRLFSHPGGLGGARETLGDWLALLTGPGAQPVQLIVLILLVYEPIAVAFGIVAVAWDRQREAVALCGGWFAAAFALWSFSAGRDPAHAVHVALPLVLLGGMALGWLCEGIAWREVWRGRGAFLALGMLGVVVGVTATGILFARVDTAADGLSAALPPVAVLCLVVVPLLYAIWRVDDDARQAGQASLTLPMALLVLALLLGAFGLRSATLLAFTRADLGTEPLAQRTATLGTLPVIERFLRLSRDVGIAEGSARDPTGSHSLGIALEEDVRWPYVWYFREFPDLTVVPSGAGPASGAEVVIAASDAGLAEAGYAVQTWPWRNTVPPAYLQPDVGQAVRTAIDPRNWQQVWRFLLFRAGIAPPAPATVAVGLTPELAQRVTVQTGPFALDDRPGPGSEPGQFDDPIGVAVGPDGIIAVVDSGNARVQRFASDGEFLEVWGGEGDVVSFTHAGDGLGPTGVTVAADGTTWVADTWGHRVVALDAAGNVVLAIGGELYDTGDDPARTDEAGGRFFGPRGIAIGEDAVYVTDTGNERVQVFTPDGRFVAAWGGYGPEPERLIEPVGIALGPDGNVYVADSGNARIAIFTPEGEPVGQWPVPEWPAAEPGGLPPAYQPYLAFDGEGNLYATASTAGQVLVFDREGAIVNRLTAAGGERLTQPIGVAFAGDGELLLTDLGRDAVLAAAIPDPLNAEDLDAEDAGVSSGP